MSVSHQTEILRLARSGSPERAWSRMEEAGLLDAEGDARALTLQARLLKDRGKRASGEERRSLFAQAATVYAQAAALDGASYPLINAATLVLLAGDPARAARLAADVLARLDADPDEPETPYWREATRAEALLLLGQAEAAQAALREGMRLLPCAWEDHAATLGQFDTILEERGEAADWLDALRPPRTLHFTGIMRVAQEEPAAEQAIAAWLEEQQVGFAFGALAAGADIWIAEAVLARGGEVHAVLPCEADLFREHSVASVDPAWLPRFDALLEQAASLAICDFAGDPGRAAVERSEALAEGMARRKAGQLQTGSTRLYVGDRPPANFAGKHIAATRIAAHPPEPADWPTELTGLVLADGLQRSSSARASLLARTLAAQLPERPGDVAAAIDIVPAGDRRGEAAAIKRLEAMRASGHAEQVLATKEAAHALLADAQVAHIEELGEMRWAGGDVPLYALIPDHTT